MVSILKLNTSFQELHNAYQEGGDVIAVHYACESFYEVEDQPPGVSSISVEHLNGREAETFSIADRVGRADESEAEAAALETFFTYARSNGGAGWVHWNMRKADFGFSALQKRYLYLTGNEAPYEVPSDRRFDLDTLLKDEYGNDYADHPRLPSTAALNGLSRRHALSGSDEGAAVKNGEHGRVRRSVEEKTHWIAKLAVLFLEGRLKTKRSAGMIEVGGSKVDAVRAVLQLGGRSRYVERELARRREGRSTITVTDEYDAQDLLRALLRLVFDDIRPEEWTPSYAGSSSRVDFVLPDFGIAIELKWTRESMTAGKVGEELTVDASRYADHPSVSHLVCIVFDHDGRLDNPRGLEKDLSQDASQGVLAVTVQIVDR